MTRPWSSVSAWLPAALMILAACLATPAPAAAENATPELARVWARSGTIEIEPLVEAGGLLLTVSGPDGFHHRQVLDPRGGATVSDLSLDKSASLPDGSYTYELRAVPEETRSRAGDPAAETGLEHRARAPHAPRVQTGSFAVLDGLVVAEDLTEPGAEVPGAGAENTLATKDFAVNDDLIVTGSTCMGFGCVSGEAFGFDTIRLKENNLRIKFQDTSTASAFPSNDWELTANDSASGGLNRFSIRDVDGERDVFTVEAGAREAALYVKQQGRVGFGTSTPVTELHAVSGDAPTLRLEQDSSAGFNAQTWDVAGNEANFFVRDATNGSALPFRIRPGAPTNSLILTEDGNVGLGIQEPAERLEVAGGIAVSGTVDGRDLGADGATLDAHVGDFDNPHQVSAAQAGADPAGTAASAVAGHESAFDHGNIPSALPVPVSEGGTGATDATGARANLGIEEDPTKVGTVAAADFAGAPAATATVTFAEPFPTGTSYAVVLTAVTSDAKSTFTANVVGKDETGFTVTLGLGGTTDLEEVDWLARPVGQ
ncbi:MAG: hypothetical protein ACLF0P_06215 [Thermoanaerobaculia bacterium]